MSLRAPIAVPIEVRAPSGRLFRLAWNVGEDGVRLEHPVPFEPGRTVEVRVSLPDAPTPGADAVLHLRARLLADEEERAVELAFLDPPPAARSALHRYVIARLGLPAAVPGS